PVVAAGALHAVVLKRDLWHRLARPLDGGRGLFGVNKTLRGVVVMVVGSTAAVLVQRLASVGTPELVHYPAASAPPLRPAIGLGYSLAELPNSFAKRRLGIGAGARAARHSRVQYVADQGDSVVGSTLALVPFVPDGRVLGLVAVVGFVLHAAFDRVLYAV